MGRPPGWLGAGALALGGDAEGMGFVQPGAGSFSGMQQQPARTYKGVFKMTLSGSFQQWAWCEDERKLAEVETTSSG